MTWRRQLAAFACSSALLGAIAWACAGPVESPTWSVEKSGYDPYGSGAILSPANDTRANLMLLLADRQAVPLTVPGADKPAIPLVMMPWDVMSERAVPPAPAPTANDISNDGAMSRCQTLASGAADCKAALMASKASPADKTALAAARDAMHSDCEAQQVTVVGTAPASPVGRAYAAYMLGAADFYGGRFDEATARFSALASADDPWLHETARYMLARNALNKAIDRSMGEYGDLVEVPKRDRASAMAAQSAFTAYLKAYPKGRYADSASGLIRRAYWIAGDGNALAATYDHALTNVRGADDAVSLIDEVDYKLLLGIPDGRSQAPLLLAVQDLEAMRGASERDGVGDADETKPRLTKADLDRQAPIFAKDPALYGYLQAAHAFWVRKDAKTALALIPDAAHQPKFSYVEFSRQMLRGMALDAVKDRNARGFWLSLMPGATQPYQRGAVELVLASHDERSGRPEAVFAQGSPITHPVMRDLLLEFTAGPALLRQQVRTGQSAHEQKVAQFILLAKGLQRGFYRDFVADSASILGGGDDSAGSFWGAQYYNTEYNTELADPPLAKFLAKPDPKTGCAGIRVVAGALAADATAVRSRLCLAEFLRTQGFDNFEFDKAPEWSGLGSGPAQFPGKPYVRMATYQSVLASPKASADDKAFALNRMIRCYAPSGYSSCGDDQPQAIRKAWYDELKAKYPASPWARELRYYW